MTSQRLCFLERQFDIYLLDCFETPNVKGMLRVYAMGPPANLVFLSQIGAVWKCPKLEYLPWEAKIVVLGPNLLIFV